MLYANPAENVHEFTLENGMQVFLLEDTTDALVHIEYTTRSGFSSQTQNNCGFYKLYTRLFAASTPQLHFTDVQCNADSSRYILNVSPAETEKTLLLLSQAAFAPDFSDELLNSELTKLKNEVSDNAEDMATYINAAIDSRVFSDAPWKHDSGIYPPLFKKTTPKTARTFIKDISNRWYIPKNSAIFISGNINEEKVLVYLKNTFGSYYTNSTVPVEKISAPINQQRKYVFHNPEISSDLTQIVIQYTMLNMEQCDLLAAALNNNASSFKKNVLSYEELNIPGNEYIDVSAAHKRNCSRLIIQTLMQPPEDKKSKVTSFQQVEQFIDTVNNIPNLLQGIEFQFAKEQLVFNMNYLTNNSYMLMDSLSSFWAIQDYYKSNEEDYENYPDSITTALMMSRINHLEKTDSESTFQTLQSENPFIFVIINSKDYKANKKAYTEAGFEEINENNSSWYVQKMFKEIRDQYKPVETAAYKIDRTNASDNYYYEKNIEQIKNTKLSNGINIVSKQNPLSTNISVILSINGGKYNSADENGFEEVMINLLAGIIQKEIYKKQVEGLILGNPVINTKTDISTSSIILEFEKVDVIPVCSAIGNAIIYGEIAPADADRAVSSRQYRKRLENGSATSQMQSSIIKEIYGKGTISNIFDTEKDILQTTDYKSILAAYPSLLDASRYNVILTGNFDNDIFELLEKSLGLLSNNSLKINTISEEAKVPKKNLTIKIRHTFLTDIPAEKAGPQPAVLIPTKEFLDPVIFANNSPKAGTKDAALYNAIFSYVGVKLQQEIDNSSRFDNSTVSVNLPKSGMNFSTIVIQNVTHTKEVDVLYRQTIQSIFEQMKEPQAMQNIIQEIKNNWIIQEMASTYSNTGTAELIQKGFEMFATEPQPDFYLTEYNYIQTATVQDYLIMKDWFPERPLLRAYSAEGKN